MILNSLMFQTEYWSLWLILGFLLLVLEVIKPTFIMTTFGCAAFIAALTGVVSAPLWLQLITFLCSSFVGVTIVRPYLFKAEDRYIENLHPDQTTHK